ncbi:MAG: hypothetical protein ACLQDQ_02145 [Myxococcaceae bacterium]
MRFALPLLLAASALSACNCGSSSSSAAPTPVTLVFTNTSSAPVFIDATDSTYGLVITPQGSAVTAPAYLETLPEDCSCLSCAAICGADGCIGSSCSPRETTLQMVELLAPDASVQRQWPGVYVDPSTQNCGPTLGDQPCLQQRNDGPTDAFTARICYALSVSGGAAADAGVPFAGALPSDSLVCATKDFQPQQGTVSLTPPAPLACDAGSCPSGQLCFSGLCTSSCPENNFPSYGDGYSVNVGTPSGSFFLQTSSATSTVSSGTGALTSISYQSGTTFLSLATDGGLLTGSVAFTVPQVGSGCCLEAFFPPETLTVTVTETPSGSGNRGLVIRDVNGQLIEAVDMATNVPVLNSTGTSPFVVTPSTTPLGCAPAQVGCNAIFAGTVFATPEGAAPLVLPGQVTELTTSGASFAVLNVTNTRYFLTSSDPTACGGLIPLAPYLILNSRP